MATFDENKRHLTRGGSKSRGNLLTAAGDSWQHLLQRGRPLELLPGPSLAPEGRARGDRPSCREGAFLQLRTARKAEFVFIEEHFGRQAPDEAVPNGKTS